jgi:putative ABC transport system permease protein
VFARKEGIHLGDTLTVAGQVLSVSGIARGGNCFLYQYAFVTLAQARRLFGLDGLVNYFLVRLSPEAKVEELALRIEQASPLVSAFPKERFIANNLSLTGDNFLPILRVLEVIGLLVGTVVIGLTIYTLTVEYSPEYGVLKAVGAPDRTLYWTATLQALVCGLLGWLVGVPLSWGVIILAQYFVPQFPAASSPQHTLWMLGCTIGMSLIAAGVPARHIARIDPLVAFKG